MKKQASNKKAKEKQKISKTYNLGTEYYNNLEDTKKDQK